MTVIALNVDQVGKIGVGLLIGLVVVGLVLGFLLTTLVARIVIAAVVIALGTYVWQQRVTIQHDLTKNRCQLSTQFFGIHVKAPADVVAACQKQLNR
jgi:type II secretory pathway pseudopilin PulG